MDTRPYDTENTINTRSRIRLCSFLSLLLAFFYINIQESFSGAHISYLHLFHLFLQPVILLASLLDFSSLPAILSYAHLVMLITDGFVAAMSAISVSRCFQESTATCAERIYEKGIWVLLAGSLCILDVIITLQLTLLNSQLKIKDIHEKEEIERLKATGDVPSWNSVLIFKNKIKVLNMFMIPLDAVYVLCIWYMVENAPVYYLSLGHLFIDPFMLYIDLGYEKTQYEYFRVAYVVLLAMNALLMVIQIQIHINSVTKMLALFISILYVITDVNQIVYMSKVVDTVEKYTEYKRQL